MTLAFVIYTHGVRFGKKDHSHPEGKLGEFKQKFLFQGQFHSCNIFFHIENKYFNTKKKKGISFL